VKKVFEINKLKQEAASEVLRLLGSDGDPHEELNHLFSCKDNDGCPLITVQSVQLALIPFSSLVSKMRSLLVLARFGWSGVSPGQVLSMFQGIKTKDGQSVMDELLSIWRINILIQAYGEVGAVALMASALAFFGAPFWVFVASSVVITFSCAAGVLLSPIGEMLIFPKYSINEPVMPVACPAPDSAGHYLPSCLNIW